jgi:hypothetical protein
MVIGTRAATGGTPRLGTALRPGLWLGAALRTADGLGSGPTPEGSGTGGSAAGVVPPAGADVAGRPGWRAAARGTTTAAASPTAIAAATHQRPPGTRRPPPSQPPAAGRPVGAAATSTGSGRLAGPLSTVDGRSSTVDGGAAAGSGTGAGTAAEPTECRPRRPSEVRGGGSHGPTRSPRWGFRSPLTVAPLRRARIPGHGHLRPRSTPGRTGSGSRRRSAPAVPTG